jgi:hypothetical protein
MVWQGIVDGHIREWLSAEKELPKLAKPFIALLQDGIDARTDTTLVSFRGRSTSKP